MSWDEAHDLTVEPEEIEEADIDPIDGGDADRPLTPEELDDLYRHSPMWDRI